MSNEFYMSILRDRQRLRFISQGLLLLFAPELQFLRLCDEDLGIWINVW